MLDAEFVIAKMFMFKLAVNLDYSDEIGCQKMFQLMRDMIGREGLVTGCWDMFEGIVPKREN